MTVRFDLKNALEDEIDRDVERIRESARSEGERLSEGARSRRERLLREAEERFEKEAELHRRRVLAKTRLEGQNALLAVKRREVDGVFEELGGRLATLAEKEPQRYADILVALFEAGRTVLPEGPLRLRAGKAEARLLKPALQAEEVEIVIEGTLGGIILETPDGRVRCDDTPAALLGRLRAEREAELERILFEEDHEPGGE